MRNGLREKVSLLLLCGSMLAVGCGGDEASSKADDSSVTPEGSDSSGATSDMSGVSSGSDSTAGSSEMNAAGASTDGVVDSEGAGSGNDGAATGGDSSTPTGDGGAGGTSPDTMTMTGPMGGADGTETMPMAADDAPDPARMDETEVLFGSGEGRNQVAAGDVCERISTIECAGEARCCNNPGRDFDECLETMLEGCRRTLLLDYMTEKAVTGFDAARAEAALTRYEEMAKVCDPMIGSIGEDPEGLRGMMQGTLEPDADCFPPISNPLEILGAYNEAAVYMTACKDPANYSCLPMSTFGWSCEPRGDDGADCFTDLNCKEGLFCPQDNPTMPQLGAKCTTALATGADCTLSNECESLACVGGKCAEAGDIQATFCLKQE